MRALALVLVLWGGVLRAELPPAVEALRPSIQVAERRLQDISLELQAAKHAAEPAQAAVSEAREKSSSWWGSWMLKRRLGQLKTSLDRVESARVGQVAARQELALLLTGADEELSAALEVSLNGSGAVPTATAREKWRLWWEQKAAWQRRLDVLAPDQGEGARSDQKEEALRIQAEARQAQWEREKAILEALGRKRALDPSEQKAEAARLKERFKRPLAAKP